MFRIFAVAFLSLFPYLAKADMLGSNLKEFCQNYPRPSEFYIPLPGIHLGRSRHSSRNRETASGLSAGRRQRRTTCRADDQIS